jgi:hypothetical protein
MPKNLNQKRKPAIELIMNIAFLLFAFCLGVNLGFFCFVDITNYTVVLNVLTIMIFASPLFFKRKRLLAWVLYSLILVPSCLLVYLPIQLEYRTQPAAPYRPAYLSDSCEHIQVSLICNNQDILTRLIFSIRCGNLSFIKDQGNPLDKRCKR